MSEKVLSGGHVSPVKASADFLGQGAPVEAGEMNQASREAAAKKVRSKGAWVPSWEEIKALKERLAKLIVERKKEYEEMHLFGKCTLIAEELGEGQPQKYGILWKYEGGDLTIDSVSYTHLTLPTTERV